MEFCIGYDNELRKKIAYQVRELCLPECIPEEKIEKIEVYLSETCNTISVYLPDSIIEIPDVFFDGIWGMKQWNDPVVQKRRYV